MPIGLTPNQWDKIVQEGSNFFVANMNHLKFVELQKISQGSIRAHKAQKVLLKIIGG